MEECPHCHATVLLMSDQRCPACQKFANNPQGATPHLTRITVEEGTVLPPICIACGVKTERREQLDSERSVGGEDGAVKALFFLFGVFNWELWLKMLSPSFQGEQQSLAVEFGRCEACASAGPIHPVRVDFERHTMVLLVHRQIARTLKSAR